MHNKQAVSFTRKQDGYTVRVERMLPFDASAVWAALTDPRKMSIWFLRTNMKLEPGARMEMQFDDEDQTISYGTITAVEPEKVFEFIWENTDGPDELVRWELFPEGTSACRLVLTHSRVDDQYIHSVPTGWHFMLDQLEETLKGRTEPFPSTPPDTEEKKAVAARYNDIFKQTFEN